MDPIGIETRLGWTVHGCYNHRKCSSGALIVHHSFHTCECKSYDSLHWLVKDFFEFDNSCVMGTATMDSDEHIRAKAIIRFELREKKIAVCGDIREMFHQVRIRKEDQHQQLVLWRDEACKEPNVFVMQAITFGASCSTSSVKFVKNKNALQYADQHPRDVKLSSSTIMQTTDWIVQILLKRPFNQPTK